jgi:hypothetical protein
MTTEVYRVANNDPVGQNNVLSTDYINSNVSFSGADAVATIILPPIGSTPRNSRYTGEVITLGELQTISYSIHRENSPIRTIGHVNPKSFIKGGRTIAGSMIFTVFDEYAFYKIREYRDLLGRQNGFFAPLADMLPPFDMVITFANEYGSMAKMKLLGMTIVDEGQTVSIDDLITEQTYTYMARGIQPLVKYSNPSVNDPGIDPESIARDLQISLNIFGDDVDQDIKDQFYQQDQKDNLASQTTIYVDPITPIRL